MAELPTRSFVARFLGSSGPASGLADAHSFLHERVALYLKVLTVVFAGFTLTGFAKGLALAQVAGPQYRSAAVIGIAVFAAVTVFLAAGWVYLVTGKRSPLALHMLESLGTVAACAALAWTIRAMPPELPEIGIFLAILLALVTRAALVPSTSVRTLLVGLVTIAALTAISAERAIRADVQDNLLARFGWVLIGSWGALFSVVTALISRVIYGLQNTVREAMKLGNYTLDKKIGEGGMGAVYLAHHALLRRPTAVKLLRPEKAGEAAVMRFEREVQQTSRLTHPNIIEIYDYGRTADGVFYYAMEYLDGLTVAELIALEGAQPPSRVIYVISQVAHALSHAHAEGLIHRDIKPANVVLCNRGGFADLAKVVDFGLVKIVDAPAVSTQTRTNTLTGTPLYMSPEALTDPAGMDQRADLYSLGAVAYFMLTGQHVFEADSIVEVCGHHLHTAPTPPGERVGRELGKDIEHVVLKCLAKSPEDRYPDAMAFRDSLLSCGDAPDWGLPEATDWWARWEREVQSHTTSKWKAIGADGDVVAVARDRARARADRPEDKSAA